MHDKQSVDFVLKGFQVLFPSHWLLKQSHAVSLLAFLFSFGACKEPPPPPPYKVLVHVESDPGKPLAGVPIFVKNKQKGVSDEQGSSVLKFAGVEGEPLNIEVKCPEGTRAGEGNTFQTTIHRSASKKPSEFNAFCFPATRKLVIAVRAENGAHLPILYLGQKIAETDASGAAHVLLQAPPGVTIQIKIDTSKEPNLNPVNPILSHVVQDHDDINVFNAAFSIVKPKKR